MSEEQWFGLVLVVLGVYFIVCSQWGRTFILYKLKVQRAIGLFGEQAAHALYLLLGIVALIAGVLKLLRYL